jgi:hypothetical protein
LIYLISFENAHASALKRKEKKKKNIVGSVKYTNVFLLDFFFFFDESPRFISSHLKNAHASALKINKYIVKELPIEQEIGSSPHLKLGPPVLFLSRNYVSPCYWMMLLFAVGGKF